MSDTASTVGRPRLPARRPPDAWPKSRRRQTTSDDGRNDCPLASLAEEAAQLIRLRHALSSNGKGRDAELLEALEWPDDFLSAEELLTEAQERLDAIVELAEHRRPSSLKGTLFQLYLVADRAGFTEGNIVTRLSRDEERALGRRDRAVGRLHYAAVSHLETLVMDDDLSLLRDRYLPRLYDRPQGCNRAIHDRDGLLADAVKAAARWKQGE